MKELMERLIGQMVEAGIFFQDAVSEFEKKYIRCVLETNSGNQSQTAKVLGIHRNTLGRKMDQYKLISRNGTGPSRKRKRKSSKK